MTYSNHTKLIKFEISQKSSTQSDIPRVLNPVTNTFVCVYFLHTLSGRTGIHKRLSFFPFFVQKLYVNN